MILRSGRGSLSDLRSGSKAVALGYTYGAHAPRVIGKGEGYVAEAIISKASDLGIPLKTDPIVVELLMKLEVNEWVPPELYQAVAEILAWAQKVSGGEVSPDHEA